MINLISLPKVNSTNTYAKALLTQGEPLKPYTVIYAKEQTEGRGRLGRNWISKAEDSLCMSLILPYSRKPGVTLLSALGVYKALKYVYPEIEIKWPNDIIAGNKKLCGILTEGTEKATVVGIGINLNQTEFSAEIAHKATSLKILTGNSYSAEELCTKVAECVFETIDKHNGELSEEALKEYSELCANIGREVYNESKRGIATGLSHDGALLIKTETCTEEIRFGEVFVNGIY